MLDISLCGLVPGGLCGLAMDLFLLGVFFLEKGVIPENPLSLLSSQPGDCLYISLRLSSKDFEPLWSLE